MIRENIEEVAALYDYAGGIDVLISIPLGAELAKKTFNPRLGIVGGISVLGTTGIVEPMSEKALVETIRTELAQRRALAHESVLLTPGNYGADFIKKGLGLDPEKAVQTSNFIGDSIDICRELGFKRLLLIGHIGKLVKLAGNMLNTHSKYGDCRMELLAAHAGKAGAPAALIGEMLDCVACDEAVRLLREKNPALEKRTLESVTEKAHRNLIHRAGDGMEIEMLMFQRNTVRSAKRKTPAHSSNYSRRIDHGTFCRRRQRRGGPYHCTGSKAAFGGGRRDLGGLARESGAAFLLQSGLRGP